MIDYHNIDSLTGKIIWGDCLDIMRRLPDKCVDLVVTDPPYGIKRDKGFGGFGGFGEPIARTKYVGDWDEVKIEGIYFETMRRISKNQIIFGGNYYSDILPQNNHWIMWDKLQTMPSFSDGELAWTSIKRNSVKKYTVEWNGLLGKEKQRIHATQKPVKLIKEIVANYSNPNDLILDPFSGSGTTAVACHELGRRWIMVEKELRYVGLSRRRLDAVIAQQRLFV